MRLLAGSLGAMLLAAAGCAPEPGVLSTWPFPPSGMTAEAWTHGRAAHQRAVDEGLTTSSLLTIIDYSLPSSEPRLWVVDLASGQVRAEEYVAHAIRSGGQWPTQFSNRDGSRQSSLGTFLTGRSYLGVRGPSLRLHGLENGINDRALARGIVIHGTPAVNRMRAVRGMLGRTDGCPAVSAEAARPLIRLIEEGVVVFVWYPDRTLLSRSQFVDRGQAAVRLFGAGS